MGEDANQALQADINADPTTRLEAATLYQDTSGWLASVHSSLSAEATEAAKDAQGPDAGGQGPAGEQPRDRIVDVEDGGLEGGQEGVAQEPAAVKQERNTGDFQQPASASTAEPVRVKEEEAEEARDRPSAAIFGDEIAYGGNMKHEDDSADPQPRQDQAGSATETSSASAQGPQSSPDQNAQDSKESLSLQYSPEPHESPPLAGHSTAKQPSVRTFTVLCRENGLLQIFTLPDMQLLFSFTNPIEGPPLLTQGGSSPHQLAEEEAKVRVVETRMESFGPRDASGDVLLEPMLDFLRTRCTVALFQMPDPCGRRQVS